MKKSIFILIAVLMSISLYARYKKKGHTNEIQSISMQRTPCFGRCPDYVVEIKSNGIVTYRGIMFVKDSGIYQKNIGVASAQKIIDKFNTYRVDTCKDKYQPPYTDAPGIDYIITYKTKTKKIIDAHFGPAFLKEFARDIDAIAKVDSSWRKIAAKAE